MTIRRPQHSDLLTSSDKLGLRLESHDISDYLTILEDVCADYDIVDSMTPEHTQVTYPRTPGIFPTPEDNPYNAWYVKTEVKGKNKGRLAGLKVALKDNVCLAGVPMMNGSSTLRGYVPDIDATVVTRLLDAGGTILGKAQCEYFCVSGSSHTSAQGAVVNPRKAGHSAGGSSSGCAALIASGHVDLAIGTDQGGSVRIPAAYSGFYGMKPTHGLIPYTGVMPIEMTLDHVGLMSNTVEHNALFLETLAGLDNLDPRQQHLPISFDYSSKLNKGCNDLRIGVVKEGFNWDNSEKDVDESVRNAANLYKSLGATVSEVSIPLHRKGHAIWSPIAVEGTTQLLQGYNYGSNWKGLYVTSLMRAQRDWQQHAAEFPHDLKSCLLAGDYFSSQYAGQYYAKAQNLVRRLKAAYINAFKDFDLLLMPTVPLKAPRLLTSDASASNFVTRALEMNANTAPFNITGLPAMSLPCGQSNGLPIGMMLIAPDFKEATIYQAAAAFERAYDWPNLTHNKA
ncbi:amidase [Marinomonas transparens]|uniref:Amidase n=1 Tax=Marinomonas transparens TaxID=2795388 RepID=A0A934MVB1_9GAMM|nr:amidase [Marinomonas transparens]MBJ7536829.1 amidase [Marinomonas transparens]